MLDIISFRLSGSFAAFKDPSVTSHQTSYLIPSKSAVVGLIGAMIGTKRDNTLGDIYGRDYLELYKTIQIGLSFDSEPKKVVYYTNHRSLKEPKTKPVKTELVDSPNYTIFVNADESTLKKITNAIEYKNFAFSPYLGHVYCPAVISDLKKFKSKETKSVGQNTSSVILDESDSYSNNFHFTITELEESSRIIVERHLHHFYEDEKFQSRVLKHWIPVAGSTFRIEEDTTRNLSKFISIEDQVVCLY